MPPPKRLRRLSPGGAASGPAEPAARRPLIPALLCAAMLALSACAAQAQVKVSFNGLMGERALLLVDGQPRVLAVGASAGGVRLLALSATRAEVEVQGERRSLALSSNSPAATPAPSAGNEIVLTAGPGGHFTTPGLINGRPVQFMVDTGASVVALSEALAQRIGLDYARGQRVLARTANGEVPGHVVVLNTVRIGDVQAVNVQALVLPATTEHVLLGNSFLGRFQMRRDNEVMRLTRRF
jgi:aspartyl protease family protein